MTISKLVSVAQEGSPWEGNDGTTNYPQRVVFEDGTNGLANAKKPQPPYRAGDLVGYQITGQDKMRNNKIKVDRKAAEGQTATTPPPARQNASNAAGTASVGQPASQHAAVTVRGETVGMSIGRAVEALKDHYDADTKLDGSFAKAIHQLASQLIRVSSALERGELAPRTTPAPVTAAQVVAAQHGFVPREPAGGGAFAPAGNVDEDVPF